MVYERIVELGVNKAKAPVLKAFFASIIGGAFIGYGAYLCLCVGGACPAISQSNPGLGKLLFGLVGLPFSLLSIILTGTELFTGNTALVTAAVLEEKATVSELLKNWVVSFTGNFIGVMIMIYVMGQSGVTGSSMATSMAASKTSLTFLQVFFPFKRSLRNLVISGVSERHSCELVGLSGHLVCNSSFESFRKGFGRVYSDFEFRCDGI